MGRQQDYTRVYGCGVEATLDVIGGKWKGVILYHMLNQTRRFNEFRRLLPEVTQRMLTLQLRELESDGLILRVVYPQVPPKVEYSLTEFGKTLTPMLLLMREWGEKYTSSVTNIELRNIGLADCGPQTVEVQTSAAPTH